jgi:hypothetical protein
LIGGLIALLAALGVGAYFLFAGSSAGASTPKEVANKLMQAGQRQDFAAARKLLCAQDNRLNMAHDLNANGRVKSYTIGTVTQASSTRATVIVTVTTIGDSTPQTTPLPVVKESGAWKVCVSDLLGGPTVGNSSVPSLPSPSITSVPSASNFPSISGPSINLPSINIPSLPSNLPTDLAGLNPCSLTGNTAEQYATTYVGMAEIGYTSYAQACVFQNSVPRAVTAALKASSTSGYYSPAGGSGSTFQFTSIDGSSHLAVTVSRESDGKLYVTKVEKS